MSQQPYCIGPWAATVVFLHELGAMFSRNVAKSMRKMFSDSAAFQRLLEILGCLCVLCFFPISGSLSVSLVIFLVSSMIWYGTIAAQAGVMLAIGTEAAIPTNVYLNKKSITLINYISSVFGWFVAPAAVLGSGEHVSQGFLALFMLAISVPQTLITYAFVRPKQKA